MPCADSAACAISSWPSSSAQGSLEQAPCLRACGSAAPAFIHAAEPAVPPPLPSAAISQDAVEEQPQALEQLLAAIDSKDEQLVAAILRRSRPAVPRDTLYLFAGTSMAFSCPICRLLKGVAGHYWHSGPLSQAQERSAVRIAELLLAAGYLPATYERVWVSEDGCWALPVLQLRFAPLADRPHWFPTEGRARYVHAVLQQQPWSPAHHASFPPAFRAAARTLLLCANAQTSAAGAAAAQTAGKQLGRPGQEQEHCVQQEAGQHKARLGDLPQELLLKVMGQAAYPLSSWL